MKEPRIAATRPAIVELKAGETVYWCSCGLSRTQPFCDGSHQGTGFEPMVFTAEKDDQYYFCQCKHSKINPLCDGTHKSLKAAPPFSPMPREINPPTCSIPQAPDYSSVTIVEMNPEPLPDDYLQAMQLANQEAERRLGEYMLLSWYDKDRDFESPQHSSECHADSAVPGYVDYGLYHGATLKIDMQQGRFVFFYMGIDM